MSDPLGLHPIDDEALQEYRDKMGRGLLGDGLHWVGEHAGEISAVTGILAALTMPIAPLSLALGGISLATGAYQTAEDINHRDYLGVVIDVASLIPGAGAEIRGFGEVSREARAAETLADIDRYAQVGRDPNYIVEGYKAWSGQDEVLRVSKAWSGVLGWTSNAFNGLGVWHARTVE